MSDLWIAAGHAQKLITGDQHDGTRFAGDHRGVARLAGEHRHRAENFILGYFADFLPINKRFGVPVDDHEDMISGVTLLNQDFAGLDPFETIGATKLARLQFCYGVGQYRGVPQQVFEKLRSPSGLCIQMLKQITAPIRQKTQGAVTAQAAIHPGFATLQAYQARQQMDQKLTVGFSDQVTRLFGNAQPLVALGRNIGLLGLDLLPPAKRWFARQAMGLGTRPDA